MPPPYFIGLTLPKDISNTISNVQHNLYDEKLLIKPLIPHITIVQPGALQTISPLWLLPKIKPLNNQYFPLQIKIGSIATYNNTVLHFKIEGLELKNLHNDIVALLPPDIKSRYYVGRFPYSPHITIAQAKPKQYLNPKYIDTYTLKLNSITNQTFVINGMSKFDHTSPRNYQIKPIT